MSSIQQTFAFVNARFFSLVDKVEDGTLTSVDILNTAGSAVVAKIVSKGAFDSALTFGGTAVEVVVPQIVYGVVPQRVGYDSLYRLVKQLRDDNSLVESAIKASYSYDLTVGLDTGHIVFTANASGVLGNNLTIELLNPGVLTAATTVAIGGVGNNEVTVTLRHDGVNVVATLAEVASVVTAASSTLHMSALATGVTSLAVDNAGLAQTNLAGGNAGTGKNYIAYDVTRTFKPSRQIGLAPTAPVRVVMIPKALADQIGL